MHGGPGESLWPTLEGCKKRQAMLREEMQRSGVQTALISGRENVYYVSGYLPPPFLDIVLILRADGESAIVGQVGDKPDAVDRIVPFESQWLATLREDQSSAIHDTVSQELAAYGGVFGADFGRSSLHVSALSDSYFVDLDRAFRQLRRTKLPDELELIKKSVSITEACYERAFEIVEPGTSELDVFTELRKAAVLAAGEELTTFRTGDFQCGTPGGAPRAREAQAGELYILDIGVAFRGYWADNCRTLAVSRELTEAQERAFGLAEKALSFVEAEAKPGVACKRLYDEVVTILNDGAPAEFPHHLGHGFGLSVHEIPMLNPHWDHELAEGDCIAVEPGLYHESLRGGVRLEQDYLVTDAGVERLSTFPLRYS